MTTPPVSQEDREAVRKLTGIAEGTNSCKFLMRGDWDHHFTINGCKVPNVRYRVPWVQAFAAHRVQAEQRMKERCAEVARLYADGTDGREEWYAADVIESRIRSLPLSSEDKSS